jgi:hypothetical protein
MEENAWAVRFHVPISSSWVIKLIGIYIYIYIRKENRRQAEF